MSRLGSWTLAILFALGSVTFAVEPGPWTDSPAAPWPLPDTLLWIDGNEQDSRGVGPWLFAAGVSSEASDLELVSIEPAVIKSGEPHTVRVNGAALGEGVNVNLIAGGTYLESVTLLEGSARWIHDIVTVGNYAYLIDLYSGLSGLRILDIQDPVRPIQLGSLALSSTRGYPGRMTVSKNRLYVPENAGLEVIDVSDPTSPRSLGLGASPRSCPGGFTAVIDRTAFLGCGGWGGPVWAFDISGDGPPKLITRLNPFEEEWNTAGAMQGAGGILFVADLERGLVALDVSNPRAPRVLSDGDEPPPHPFYGAWDMSIDGGYAYTEGWGNQFLVYDIRNPNDIQRVSQSAIWTNRPGGIAVEGTLGLFTDYNAMSPYIVDFSDRANPFVAHRIPYWNSAHFPNLSIETIGHHVLQPGQTFVPFSPGGYTAHDAMLAFNVEHRKRTDVLSRIQDVRRPIISGDLMVVTSYSGDYEFDDTIQTYDITDPANPLLLGQVAMPEGEPVSILAVEGPYVYAGTGTQRAVFDISMPANPVYLGAATAPGSFLEENCDGSLDDFGLIADGLLIRSVHYGTCARLVEILQFTTPLVAVPASILDGRFLTEPDNIDGVGPPNLVIENNLLYIFEYFPEEYRIRLTVFDVANPSAPVRLSSLDLPGRIRSCFVENDLLYLITRTDSTDTRNELVIMDYSDPVNPFMRSTLSRGLEEACCVSGSDGYLHVHPFGGNMASGFYQTLLIDARDPDAPRTVGGASAMRARRTGEVSALNCGAGHHYEGTCLVSLLPTRTGGYPLDDSAYVLELPDTLRPGPYHVVAFDESGQVDVLPNALIVQDESGGGSQDSDGDGHFTPEDCDDNDPQVNPDAADLPGNAIDEDCDGEVVCNPEGPWLNHGRYVSCVARSCNSLVDEGRFNGSDCSQIVSAAARAPIGGPNTP